jgi:LysR family glycine cleavage system transcriptional activator
MRKRLPPLNSLVAFEAVSDLGSFSKAGESLSVTHSAVSHQIKQLEEHLGVRLFERLPRKVVLTAEGTVYLREVRAALSQLEGAEHVLREHSASRPLRISVLPSFAGNLLIPEMLPFLQRNPHIRVEIDATAGIENEESADIDVFIRFGGGDWAGFESVRLLAVRLFPVCSRAYLDKHGPFDAPVDLTRAVLLRHTHEPWDAWLDAAFAGAGGGIPVIPAGPLFSDARLMLDAACDGHGVALARSVLAAADLRDGKLLPVCNFEVESPRAYHAYLRPSARARPSTQAFVEWLLATCSRLAA